MQQRAAHDRLNNVRSAWPENQDDETVAGALGHVEPGWPPSWPCLFSSSWEEGEEGGSAGGQGREGAE